VVVCAQLNGHGSIRLGGAALTIETGAKFQIGPIEHYQEMEGLEYTPSCPPP
jgi:hypothetical protein